MDIRGNKMEKHNMSNIKNRLILLMSRISKKTYKKIHKEMYVIYKAKGKGKTTDLIKLASADNGYIVCCSCDEAYRIRAEAKIMGRYIPFPITFDKFLLGQFPMDARAFYIDNADMLLETIARHVPVKAITITKANILEKE
jgi:hypothetical protein